MFDCVSMLLLQASEQFQFKGLKLACEDFMLPQIGPTNCIGFYKFAKLYSLKRLRERARKTMLTRFLDVVRQVQMYRYPSYHKILEKNTKFKKQSELS